ncbi:MAG: hypothetical protein QME83_13145 [Thermodesulfobacteriota bacterium]|nr:hypothetical protein [Thermodesulfobacteriota bacterium]
MISYISSIFIFNPSTPIQGKAGEDPQGLVVYIPKVKNSKKKGGRAIGLPFGVEGGMVSILTLIEKGG